jgi:alpha-ketoglutarate-dependent taurine dioxygenase
LGTQSLHPGSEGAADLTRQSSGQVPLCLRPDRPHARVQEWVGSHRAQIDAWLLDPGALLFRGFATTSLQDFENTCASVSGPLMEYEYRSNNRSRLAGNVFDSTAYPASERIPFHNEMSYFSLWPRHVWFMCELPATAGGATSLADSRTVYQRIPSEVRQRFERLGVRYTRTLSPEVDLPWQEVFQTTEKQAVERYCREFDIHWTWIDDERLRTSQTRSATAIHPITGEPVWFNQAHLFHPTSLGEEVHSWLLSRYGEENLPRNAYYGNGSPIEPEVLDLVRGMYDELAIPVHWETGDILAFDNMLFAHARDAFEPPRRIVVGLAGKAGQSTIGPAG